MSESADAQDCGVDEAWIGSLHAWAIQGCDGSSSFVGATLVLPVGRIDAQWDHDESAGYSSLAVVMPPRFASWYADADGCTLEIGVAGNTDVPCPGAPPAPPSVPWGHLLP